MVYRTRSDIAVGAHTWWGQRWLDAVRPAFSTRTARFDRGDADARIGQLSGLTVLPGKLAGRAQGDRATAHTPVIVVPTLDEHTWDRVTESLATTVRPALELLHDRLPEDVDERFDQAGAALFPDADDVECTCTCGVTDGPCRHVAGLHHVFARAVDDHPLLLFAVRGRSPERFLAGLRATRAGSDEVVLDPEVQTVEAEDLDLEGYDRLRGDLTQIRVHPELAEDPAALLARLGAPPRIDDPTPLEERIEIAAQTAWKLAAGEGSDAADDELLLAELRARRMATAGVLADALGWDPDRTLELLTRLYEAGTVMRTGRDLDARYRAG
ncbi:MAG TPA: SWIM zinc finger family protein [Nitriliruptorales bacterium]